MRNFILLTGLVSLFLVPFQAHADPRFRTPVNTYTPAAFYQFYDNDTSGGIRSWQCGTKTYDNHRGTDIMTGYGTPLYAAASGALYYRYDACPNTGSWGNTCGGKFGNHVYIAHTYPYNASSSWISVYGHMAQGVYNVRGLGSVNCGAWIGNAASSGSSTAPHVHFEIRHYGYPNDDPFAGACSGPISMWVNQNGGLPTTQCQ